MELTEVVSVLTDKIVEVGGQVDDMPGLHAFGLGLMTWFIVEQILRRIMSWMRWAIIIGAIAGLGLSMPWLSDQLVVFQDRMFAPGATGSQPNG